MARCGRLLTLCTLGVALLARICGSAAESPATREGAAGVGHVDSAIRPSPAAAPTVPPQTQDGSADAWSQPQEVTDGEILLKDARGELARLPFRMAQFGGAPTCDLLRVVLTEPRDGCGDVQNELFLRGALAVVERGSCTFLDKAINTQWAGAGAVMVANRARMDADRLVAMPRGDQDQGVAVTVPVAMVRAQAGEALLEAGGRPPRNLTVFAQFRMAPARAAAAGGAQTCTDAQLAALPTLPTLATGAGQPQRLAVSPHGAVTVPEASIPPPEALADAPVAASVAVASHDSATDPSVPTAAGGNLYVSLHRRSVSDPGLRRERNDLRARSPLPLGLQASYPRFRLSGGAAAKVLAASDAEGEAGLGSGSEARSGPDERTHYWLVEVDFLRANFGGPLGEPGALAPPRLAVSEPADACGEVRNLDEVEGAAVLAMRGGCPMAEKARRLQDAGAAAVVLINNEEGLVAPQGAGPGSALRDIGVPVVMVTQAAGAFLTRAARTASQLADRAAEVEAGEAEVGADGSVRVGAADAAGAATARASALEELAPRGLLFGRPSVAAAWAELAKLANQHHWPKESGKRRELYRQLSRGHHPDKGGSADRFDALQRAFQSAEYYLRQAERVASAARCGAQRARGDEGDAECEEDAAAG